jgi:hypothetical protein
MSIQGGTDCPRQTQPHGLKSLAAAAAASVIIFAFCTSRARMQSAGSGAAPETVLDHVPAMVVDGSGDTNPEFIDY